MRSLLFLLANSVLVGSVVFTLGCIDRPEMSPSAYGIVLEALPSLKEAEEPYPFPMEGDNDHQNCKFDEFGFLI